MGRLIEVALSVVKYLLALFMIFAGVATALSPGTTVSGGHLGFLYHSHISLLLFGLVFLTSGLTLLYGKIRSSRRLVGIGLMSIFCCFWFTAILNAVAGGGATGYWMGNAVMALITGALYLRWKYQHHYVNPRHFKNP